MQVYMLFYTELPTGAIAFSVLSIPTICMSRADQRGKATRHLQDNLPCVVRNLHKLAAAPEVRRFHALAHANCAKVTVRK